jgi:hypothetical protein
VGLVECLRIFGNEVDASGFCRPNNITPWPVLRPRHQPGSGCAAPTSAAFYESIPRLPYPQPLWLNPESFTFFSSNGSRISKPLSSYTFSQIHKIMEVVSSQSKKRGYSQFLEHNSVASSKNQKPLVVSTEQDRLCARCRAIDLEAIFRKKIKLHRGSFIADLRASVKTLKASECAMCQLFGSVSPSNFDSEGSARSELCHLRAFSANQVFARLKGSEMREIDDTILLGVVRVKISDVKSGRNDSWDSLNDSLKETGYLCPIRANQRQSILEVRLLSDISFDLGFALECIAYCSENHRQTCSTMEASPIESLRVIDCQTGTIIRAPAECQYVALSYVWGPPTTLLTNTEAQNIPPTIQNEPKTISDAIHVTLQLGIRYLWIDRYCIDQSNKDEKHNTIRVMDLIYSNARLTIIATAGDNPDYGLPGVRGTVRQIQPHLRVGGHSLVSTLPHPRWSIKHSKWASRGWTYQEGLLSKRRLVFTDYQIFYECNGMHCVESLVLPRDQLHVKSKKEFKVAVPGGAFSYKDPGKKPWEIMSYVAGFNKRDLTFPSDAVIAMQGIFNSFSNGRRPLYHLMGVPFHHLKPFTISIRDTSPYIEHLKNVSLLVSLGTILKLLDEERNFQAGPGQDGLGI